MEPAEFSEQAGGSYLRAVGRHWLLVVFLTLVTTGVALLVLSRTHRSYEASASVLVTPVEASDPAFIGTGAVVDTGDPARTVQTAAALIDSPAAAAAAAQTLGSGWTGGGVKGSTSVTPRGQSNVLAVSGRARTADEAARLANAFAQAAVETRGKVVQQNIASRITTVQSRLTRLVRTVPTSPQVDGLKGQLQELQAAQDSGDDPTLSVSQLAQPPGSPTGAPPWLVVLAAALAGVALGSVAALALEYFSSRIHDPNEVASLLSTPILAVVPRLRAGETGNLSPKALPPPAFEQVRMLKAQIPRHPKGSAVMITSADAGDGKTTVAAALAAACAEGDQDVILLDFDLRAPAVAGLFALEDGLRDGNPVDWKARLHELLVPVPGYPRLKALVTHHGDFATFDVLTDRLPGLLAEARLLADWVIVDTPPIGEVSDAVPIAGECDEVLVVVRPGHTDRSRLIVAREMLQRIDVTPAGTVLVGQRSKTMSGRYYGYGYARTNHKRRAGNDWLRRIRSNGRDSKS